MGIVLLDTKIHIRTSFQCEENSLELYLKNQSGQDMRKGLAACFVQVNDQMNVLGYYTLANHSIPREAVPQKYAKKVPHHYDIPVTLLGRLARDISKRGKGMGEELLVDALLRSYLIAQKSIASMAIVTDPINNRAVDFYGRYGFIQLPESERMFLPMQVIAKLTDGKL